MKYAYYPGCSAKSTCPELDQSTNVVARELGIELVELEVAGCTGSRQIRDLDRDLFLTLNARTLALAENMNLDVLTVCATCLLNLTEVNKTLRDDPGLMERINENLSASGLSYCGGVEVTHLLWVLLKDIGAEELGRKTRKPLTGLRVAPFYGCHILKPKEVLGFDDPDYPTSLENLIRVIGAKPVDYKGKRGCCGFHVLLDNEDVSLKMSGKHLSQAKDEKADCLVTTCPLCHTALDPYQTAIEKQLDMKLDVPIIHLPQLLGLALGLDPGELKLSDHVVSPSSMLAKTA